MIKPRHILICGNVDSGKSYLINQLIGKIDKPIYGFITKRMPANVDGFHPIYIYPASCKNYSPSPDNLVGLCNSKRHGENIEVFNTLGVKYLNASNDGVIVMDELGFLESKAKCFTSKVISVLDGDVPAIIAVKAKYDVDFLNLVRQHENATLFNLTNENRDEIYSKTLDIVKYW